MSTRKNAWSLTLDRYVGAPRALVWEVLTDLEGATAHLPGVVAVERLSDDGPGTYAVGTRWRETRRMVGQEASEEMEVVAVDPQRRTEIRADHGATRYLTGFDLLPAGNGARPEATLLRFRFSAEPIEGVGGWRARLTRGLGAVTAPLGIAATRSAMRTELRQIALLAEERAALG